MRLIGEYIPETIFFYHSYWYDFKQIKGHTVLFIDFYKYGGSQKKPGRFWKEPFELCAAWSLLVFAFTVGVEFVV